MKTRKEKKKYLYLRLEENPEVVVAIRDALPKEKGLVAKAKTKNEEETSLVKAIEPYERIIYILRPYDFNGKGQCNCKHWRVKKTDCIHLKEFKEKLKNS